MEQGQNGRWEMTSYSLLPITPATESHQATQDKIDSFMEIVDSSYLSRFGYNRSQVLARNEITFATASDLYDTQADHNLGNLLSDAFKYAVSNADTGDTHPVDVAIVPSGCVRDTFAPGDITVEDVFNAYSLGIGLDGVAGYPLISIYLTGAELKTGAEIDASVSDLMPSARLYTSGLSYSFNPHRIILNKVTDCYLTDDAGNRTELQDDRLYRIICDLYSGQMLGAVTDVSYGILSIQPKFADGTPIENIEDAIIQTEAGELKAWAAIAEYMDSLPDTDGDGISDIPAVYGTLQGRKVIEDSRNILHLIKGLNKYAVVIILVVLLILALLITLIFLIVRFLLRLTKRKKTTQN